MNSSHDAQANSTLVLLLKTKSTPNDGYEEQFSPTNTGGFFDSTFVPVLEHNYLDNGLSVVEELLRRQQIGISEGMKYGGLIFTSQRAVEVFSRLVDEGKGMISTSCSAERILMIYQQAMNHGHIYRMYRFILLDLQLLALCAPSPKLPH